MAVDPQFFFKTAPGQPAFSEEVCTRAFEPTRPYPQNPSAIIYKARFKQLRAYYTKPVPNTPHPNLPQVYFADDIDFQDKMGGLIEWTRIYTTIPNSWDDFNSTGYTFPGLILVRAPLAKIVTEKITHDYFAVGSFTQFDNPLTNYDDLSLAPWTAESATRTANATNIPACAGGANAATLIAANSGASVHLVYQSTGEFAALPLAVFLKNGNTNVARVAMTNDSGGIDIDGTYATFDLRTGLLVANANAVGMIAAIGDGWWRAGLVPTGSAQTNVGLAVALCDDNGNTTFNHAGRSLYAWRGQMATGITGLTTIPHATVPPVLTPDATNYPISNADQIAVKFGLQYLYTSTVNVPAEVLSAVTTPNINTYNAWVAADAANGNSNSYSIESEDSGLSLWNGSIWLRQRHFVKAR